MFVIVSLQKKIAYVFVSTRKPVNKWYNGLLLFLCWLLSYHISIEVQHMKDAIKQRQYASQKTQLKSKRLQTRELILKAGERWSKKPKTRTTIKRIEDWRERDGHSWFSGRLSYHNKQKLQEFFSCSTNKIECARILK